MQPRTPAQHAVPAAGPGRHRRRHAGGHGHRHGPHPGGRTVRTRPHIELQARTNLLVNDEGWNDPPGSSFNSITTALSDDAQIAFPLQIATIPGDPTSYTAAVWLGQGGEGDLVHRLPVNSSISSSVHINDAGDVAFTGGDATANVLFLYDAALEQARQVSTMPVVPVSYSLGGIDEDQNVGFQGNFAGNRAFAAVIDGTGVFYAQDEGLDPESPFSYLYSATYNDNQQIAAKVSLTESFNHQQIHVFEAGGSSQVVLATDNVDSDSSYRAFDNSVGLADDGTVAAFATLRDGGGKVLVRTDGTSVEHVADTSADSPLASFDFFAPDINTQGEVVFRAVDKDGKRGVWVADGDDLREILVEGDVVETDLGAAQIGQHDTSPAFGGAPQINNRGDVSITAGVHPEGDNQVEWGTGVFIAYADAPVDPEPPVEPIEVERWEGANRYGTAAEVASTYAPGVDVVFLTTGLDYPDALTGSALAGSLDAPALLTRTDNLGNSTTAAIERLEPEHVVVLGGKTAVEDVVLEQAAAVTGAPVERLEGNNRYGTAAAVAAEFGTAERVFITNGLDYPEALSAAARAGSLDSPVLLVRQGSIPSATAAALDVLAPSQITVLGEKEAVADDVVAELGEWAPTTRVGGLNRWITSALLFAQVASADTVYLASGQDWPDALAGGAKAGSDDEPLLITRHGGLPSAIEASIVRLFPDKVVVLGGELAVSEAVIEELEGLRGQD